MGKDRCAQLFMATVFVGLCMVGSALQAAGLRKDIEDIIQAQVKMFEVFKAGKKLDTEGVKILRLLREENAFALTWAEAIYSRKTKQSDQLRDRAVFKAIDESLKQSLPRTASMLWEELSSTARFSHEGLSAICRSAIGLKDGSIVSSLAWNCRDRTPFHQGIHYSGFVLARDLSRIRFVDDKTLFDSYAKSHVCKNRSSILLNAWWKYFETFRRERRVGLPVSFEGNNNAQTEKALLAEKDLLYDDYLPLDGCYIVQGAPKNHEMIIACTSHGAPNMRQIQGDDIWFLDCRYTKDILNRALSDGFDGDRLEPFLCSLIWSFVHEPYVKENHMYALTEFLLSSVHSAHKVVLLRYFLPALCRTDFDGSRRNEPSTTVIHTLEKAFAKIVKNNTHRYLEAYSCAALLVLNRGDLIRLKNISISNEAVEGLKNLDGKGPLNSPFSQSFWEESFMNTLRKARGVKKVNPWK